MQKRQLNFLGGEISSRFWNRFEIPQYAMGAHILEGFIVLEDGTITRCPGTIRKATAANNALAVMVPFTYSIDDHYMLEFTALVIRVYDADGDLVYDGNDPYELATPFTEAELFNLQYYETDNTLYIVTGARKYYTLTRTSDTSWSLSEIDISNEPFGTINTESITLTASAVNGSITLTANGGTPFEANDKGRNWQISHDLELQQNVTHASVLGFSDPVSGDWLHCAIGADYKIHAYPVGVPAGSAWTGIVTLQKSVDNGATAETIATYVNEDVEIGMWGILYEGENHTDDNFLLRVTITSVTLGHPAFLLSVEPHRWNGVVKIDEVASSTSATATVLDYLASTDATTLWRRSTWSADTGYPRAISFQGQRMIIGPTTEEPTRLDWSKVADYDNFAHGTDPDDPFGFILTQQTQNAITWICGDYGWELVVATGNAIVELRPFVETSGFAATNPPKAHKMIARRTIRRQPVILDDRLILIGGVNGRRLYELSRSWERDGLVPKSLTWWADHIAGTTGFQQICRQQDPQQMLWLPRNDGVLAGMTYYCFGDVPNAAWYRRVMSGSVISAATRQTSTGDELWLCVLRTLNGTATYCIEVMDAIDVDASIEDGYFLDCGAKWDGGDAATIQNVTKAAPGVVSLGTWPQDSDGNDLDDGDTIIVHKATGMTEINDQVFTVANADSTAKTLTLQISGTDIDTSSWGRYTGSGTLEWVKNTITVAHLANETVKVKADGIPATKTATDAGVVTCDYANTIHVGINYISTFTGLPLEAYRESIGKTKTLKGLIARVHNTCGGQYKLGEGSLIDIPYYRQSEDTGLLPVAKSGTIHLEGPGGYTNEDLVYSIVQSEPYPMTITGLVAELGT